jgi:glycosyltransferase involved in cell wall biosynthesis
VKTTICLSMIVKNETHIIKKCLESVKPIINYWVIVDTGSTDGTQELVKEILKDIPGELHQEEWKNFGYNKTQALELAQGKADYTLTMDADDYLEILPEAYELQLTKDAYYLTIHYSNLMYDRLQIFKSSDQWKYVGVLHEYPECSGKKNYGHCKEIIYHVDGTLGNRSSDPLKYLKDAIILEEGLIDEPNNSRYVFYLAQSYRDARKFQLAYDNYKKRAEMGGWEEEVFYSLYQMATLLEKMKAEDSKIIEAYLNAYQYRSCRVEPLHQLAVFYRKKNEYQLAFLFAEKGKNIPLPNDLLFLEKNFYQWKMLDEYAVAASWIGKYKECQQTNILLLEKKNIPKNDYDRIKKNLEWVNDKLNNQKTKPKSSNTENIKTIFIAK